MRDLIASLVRTPDELDPGDGPTAPPAVLHPESGAPRRLHPAGVAVLGIASLQSLALPLGIAFVGGVMGGRGWRAAHSAPSLFGAARRADRRRRVASLGWLTTTWSVGTETIRLRTGAAVAQGGRRPARPRPGARHRPRAAPAPVRRARRAGADRGRGGRTGEITLPARGGRRTSSCSAHAYPRAPRRRARAAGRRAARRAPADPGRSCSSPRSPPGSSA